MSTFRFPVLSTEELASIDILEALLAAPIASSVATLVFGDIFAPSTIIAGTVTAL